LPCQLAWGPLSLLTVFAILTAAPTRHALQLIVCTAHLYGVALYYLTNWVEGVSYSRPEFLYFWVYYVGFNLPWAIVPLCKSFSPCSPVPLARAIPLIVGAIILILRILPVTDVWGAKLRLQQQTWSGIASLKSTAHSRRCERSVKNARKTRQKPRLGKQFNF
jgi:hypothetical protein